MDSPKTITVPLMSETPLRSDGNIGKLGPFFEFAIPSRLWRAISVDHKAQLDGIQVAVFNTVHRFTDVACLIKSLAAIIGRSNRPWADVSTGEQRPFQRMNESPTNRAICEGGNCPAVHLACHPASVAIDQSSNKMWNQIGRQRWPLHMFALVIVKAEVIFESLYETLASDSECNNVISAYQAVGGSENALNVLEYIFIRFFRGYVHDAMRGTDPTITKDYAKNPRPLRSHHAPRVFTALAFLCASLLLVTGYSSLFGNTQYAHNWTAGKSTDFHRSEPRRVEVYHSISHRDGDAARPTQPTRSGPSGRVIEVTTDRSCDLFSWHPLDVEGYGFFNGFLAESFGHVSKYSREMHRRDV